MITSIEKVQDEIIYPFPSFDGFVVYVWERTRNSIPQFTWLVVYLDLINTTDKNQGQVIDDTSLQCPDVIIIKHSSRVGILFSIVCEALLSECICYSRRYGRVMIFQLLRAYILTHCALVTPYIYIDLG